jgi:4-amino-4-deoxy-L-arabinose transferase-like glycosyltransferase
LGDVVGDSARVSDARGDQSPGNQSSGDQPRGRTPQPWIGQYLLPIALIVIVCFVASAFHVANHKPLGPLDEQAHLDYVNRILDGQWPRVGDKLSGTTLEQVACRGLETPAGFGEREDCAHPRTLDHVPEEGNAYEAGQPPAYYVVTAWVSLFAPGDDIDSLRIVGGLWLGAGAIGLFLALRRLRIGLLFALAASLVLALTPPLWFASAVVSNDIAVWAFGGLALWAVVWLMQTEQPRWWHFAVAGAVGVAGGFTKPTTLLIVAAFALALVLQQTWSRRAKWGWYLAGTMVLGVVVATGIWGLVVTSISDKVLTDIEPWKRFHVESLDLQQLFRQPLFNLISPYKAFVSHDIRIDWILNWMFEAAVYVGVGLLFLPMLARWPDGPGRPIGLAYSVAIAISGPYYVTLYFLSTSIVYGADSRFAFGFLPMAGIVLATWVPRAWQRWSLIGVLALPVLWYALLLGGAATPAPQ